MTRDKVIDQIRKMMMRTEANGATASEAEAAAAHVRYLMAKHNLAMMEVENATEDAGYIERTIDVSARAYDTMFLSNIVKKYYFTFVFQRGKKLVFFGSPDNVEVAEYVYAYLSREYRRLWQRYKERTGAGRGQMRLYFSGLTEGLTAKLDEEKRKFSAEQSTALVALDKQIAKAAIEKFNLSKAPRSVVRGTADDLEAGRRDGRNIRMTDALTGGRSEGRKQLT